MIRQLSIAILCTALAQGASADDQDDHVAAVVKTLGGTPHVRLPSGETIDIVSGKLAIIVTSTKDWPRAIGRSTNASIQLGEDATPCVVFVKSSGGRKAAANCEAVCRYLGIRMFIHDATITPAKTQSVYVPTPQRTAILQNVRELEHTAEKK